MSDYLLPYDEMVEREVIGAMLCDPELIADVIEKVSPEDFYLQTNQVICKAIFDVYQNSSVVDIPEVVRYLTHHNLYSSEILTHMTECAESIASTVTLEHYIDRLLILSWDRKLKAAGAKIAATNPATDRDSLEAALSEAETLIASISDETVSDDYMTDSSSMFDRYFDQLERVYERGNPITGVATGIPDLDHITSGFQKSDLIILAGRPSMGKTAFAINLAMGMRENGYKGVFFEIEMDELSVANRMISRNAQINSKLMQTGMISKKDLQRLKTTKENLKRAYTGLHIDTTPNLSIAVLKAKARKLKRQGELDFIIVDYLQLLTGVKGSSRNEEVGEIARALKVIARELNVPVIALAQLSRAVEMRNDKRPMLSDLRDSGEIEQHADLVIFLYRDEYYNAESEEKNIAEIILSKHRNGALGTVKMIYRKEYNLFLPLAKDQTVFSEITTIRDESAATVDLPWEEGEL